MKREQSIQGELNLGTTVLEALRAAGVEELFGIPGDFVLPFFKVIEQSSILPLYTLSHEPAVGFAADGAARIECRPSAAVVTYGAGALNMVNPIAAAYAEQVPIVVVSGGPGVGEQHGELLLHHQAKRLDSQYRIYGEITCAQTRLSDPREAPGELSRVLSECVRQSRPVYIELPRDLVSAACGAPLPLTPPTPTDPAAIDACVDEVLERLQQADSPILMVGVEIRRLDIESEVAELARRLGIPVVTSFMGRGLLTGHQVPLLGTYLGVAGDPDLSHLVESSDAPFLLGVIPSDTNLGISREKLKLKRGIVAQNGRVSLDYHVYPDLPLPALIRALIERLPTSPSDCQTMKRMPSPAEPDLLADTDERQVTPDDVADAVNQLCSPYPALQIVADVGDSLFVSMDIDDAHLAAPGYYASMGYAVPAGLGIQAASGTRPLIIVGDGAFQMTGWELGNCARYGWDPVVLVLNNAGWEMLRAFQPESDFNNLDCWNFADLARDLGGESVRVSQRHALFAALETALQRRGKFQLIEVMLPRGATSRTMQRYVKGIARRSRVSRPVPQPG